MKLLPDFCLPDQPRIDLVPELDVFGEGTTVCVEPMCVRPVTCQSDIVVC